MVRFMSEINAADTMIFRMLALENNVGGAKPSPYLLSRSEPAVVCAVILGSK